MKGKIDMNNMLKSKKSQGKQVYFSKLLPEWHPKFFAQVEQALVSGGVSIILLPHTKDIWCRDYMPLRRLPGDEFIQFKYWPSYLKTKAGELTITDPRETCQAIGIQHRVFDLVVDGGNVVRYRNKAIMTERVYRENPGLRKSVVHGMLMDLLNLHDLIMIPVEPGDPYGHADGCVRFVDQNMVLINERLSGNEGFSTRLRDILLKNGLQWIEMPYSFENDPKHKDSAVGNYINFLQVEDLVLVPSYAGHERLNQKAVEVVQRAFGSGTKVVSIESTSVAKEGGVLNCVSWN